MHIVNNNIGDRMISDLMLEAINIKDNGLVTNIKRKNGLKVTTVLSCDDSVVKKGKYITIEFKDIFNKYIKNEVIKELKVLLKDNNINDDDSALIIGLGNDDSTPDSLGPLVIGNIIVTRHLESLGLNSSRVVSAIKPGVTGETGIETKDIIKGVIEKVKPAFLIVIDALKSESLQRLSKTIQLTDTGIHPGSGVNNKRIGLSKETLGIPVIAIGVPTVCDIKTIIKGVTKKKINNIPEMIVTPKNIDFIIEKMSDLLSVCINSVLYGFKI